MKKLCYLILFLYLSIISLNCQKEPYSWSGPEVPFYETADPITTNLQGNVIDENGHPASGVAIHAGQKTAVTNARGYFRIINTGLDKNVSIVTAEKTGYFKAYRVFGATSGLNQVVIKLIKKNLAGTINASSGGDVSLSNGSKITLPPNSVVKLNAGASYNGSVKIYAAYIDPSSSDIAQTVPGSFLAHDKDNNKVLLSSYGMMAVELESSSGEKLQVAPDHKAILTIPIPYSLQVSAPATIPLWYVNETSGVWKEQGMATRVGTSYVGDVSHFSYWNCDVPGPTVNLSAVFKKNDGLPLVNAQIRIVPSTGYTSAHGFTDSLGQVHGPVPANVNLVLEVLSPCNTILYSQNIGPFPSNTDIGTITVPDNPLIVTIRGRLLNCSGSPVVHGYASINYDNMIRFVSVGSNGEFSTTISTCSGMPPTCEVYGVDDDAQQMGVTINVNVTPSITDAGDISACGTSALQYINYNIDGANYSVSSLNPGDRIRASSYDSLGNTTGAYISGSHSNIVNIDFDFVNNGTVGIYSTPHLYLLQFWPLATVVSFSITLTNYPDAVGEFFEGSFSGQFRDSTNITHTISGSLRAQREN